MLYKEAIYLFKTKLKEVYGNRLVKIKLYGSYARGEQDDESDIDLLVLLSDLKDFWKELKRINEIEYEVNDYFDFRVMICAVPASVEKYENQKTPLFLNIKKEGISV